MSRQLTDQDKNSIVKKLTGGWDSILNDAVDVFDRANFVVGEEERSPIATAVRSLTRLNCRRWARADKNSFSTSVNLANANICGLYLEGLGENPNDGNIEFPFLGGQCQGVRYQVSYKYFRNPADVDPIVYTNTQTVLPGSRQMFGPISVLGKRAWNAGSTSCGNVNTSSFDLSFFTSAGDPREGSLNLGGSPCRGDNFRIEDIVFTRIDGGQECPNPTPIITPPPPITGAPTLPPTIPINLPGYGPVDVSVTLNPDGSFKVCVDQLQTCFDIDLGSEIEPTPGEGGIDPGNIGSPGDSSDSESGGEAEGDAPENQVLTGLRLQILSSPPTAKLFTSDVFRGVGYVYMGVPGNLALHFGAATMTDDQFIFAERDNLTSWLFRANPGYNIRVTPYYLEV